MLYSFLYVISFSLSLILIQKLNLTIPPLFSLLITASIASLYFNIINFSHLRKIYLDCFKNIKNWLLVMCIVLGMWSTTMMGPGKIDASLFNFIYFAWLGMLGFLLNSLKNWQKNKMQFYLALLLCGLITICIISELKTSFSYQALYGIILALIGGLFSFIYFKNSQKLAKKADLSATQVLAVRFYFSIIIIVIILPKSQILQLSTLDNISSLCLLAFMSLIIPLYFSQKALEKISAEQHAIINSLCPMMTGVFQQLTFNNLESRHMIIYVVYTVTLFIFYFIFKYHKKVQRNCV